jgi:hypothetical protein
MKKHVDRRTEELTVVAITYEDKICLTNCGYFIGGFNNVVYTHSLTSICLPYIILSYVGLLNKTL